MSKLHELVRRIEKQYAKSTEMAGQTEPLEDVLKGRAVELWSNQHGRLFLVADEADAAKLMPEVRRGEIYTAMEMRRIITIEDTETVAELHAWKREFDGVVPGDG